MDHQIINIYVFAYAHVIWLHKDFSESPENVEEEDDDYYQLFAMSRHGVLSVCTSHAHTFVSAVADSKQTKFTKTKCSHVISFFFVAHVNRRLL